MNNVPKTPAERLAELLALAADSNRLKKAVFSKPPEPSVLRTVITLRTVGGKTVAQAETLKTDNKALHENIAVNDVPRFLALTESFGQVNLLTTAGDCELRRSKSGKVTLLGGDALARALSKGTAPVVAVGSNNRQKQYILDGREPFLSSTFLFVSPLLFLRSARNSASAIPSAYIFFITGSPLSV